MKKRLIDFKSLTNTRLFAFCGIARPEAFWNTLEKMGLQNDLRSAEKDIAYYTEIGDEKNAAKARALVAEVAGKMRGM